MHENSRKAPVATLCHSRGSKPITNTDMLWLARMINGETWGRPSTEDAESMLWSLAQRSVIGAHRKKSLGVLAQQYSQPISRKWLKTGKRCGKYYHQGRDRKVPTNCKLSIVNRRENNRQIVWAELPEVARASVIDFISGYIPNPLVGSVGWYSPRMWKKRANNGMNKKDNQVFHSEIDGNVYFYRARSPDTRKWNGSEVTIVPAAASCR